ncbi:MAG TPA: [FeFe] hydrogenase, group A [Azonexus sp.]|nr:[FeFe] hydrogenase, group A [Azonexus sp.]
MNTTINGIEINSSGPETILQAARRLGVYIPTLCELHDIGHAPGTCRVCLVEVHQEGVAEPRYLTACDTPLQTGWRVMTRTPAIQEMRRMQVEMALADHNQDCATCSRTGDCELLEAARNVGVQQVRFHRQAPRAVPQLPAAGSAIVYDQSRCIRCLRCVAMCRDTQSVDALEITGHGAAAGLRLRGGDGESACVACGQCVMVCPTGALTERDQTRQVIEYLADPDIVTVFQIAPAIRVGFGQEFGLPPGSNVEGQIVTALHRIGANVVLDTSFGADLVVMEEGFEVLDRVRHGKGPVMTSCCPGWVNFAEKYFPEILPNLSSTRSPQQCLASLVKRYLPQKMGVPAERIRMVSIMPCTAKKEEAARPEFLHDGTPDVDVVLTIREFAKLLRAEGVDLKALPATPFDTTCLAEFTGAGLIFGTSGGVMEAALRTLYYEVNGKELEDLEIQAVRGEEFLRSAVVDVGGDVGQVRVAICQSLKVARKLAERILAGESDYDFVEVMACPGGCINGGGHLRSKRKYFREVGARREALFKEDRSKEVRQAHRNGQLAKLYDDLLKKPLSHTSHDLLHTHYRNRKPALQPVETNRLWAEIEAEKQGEER